MGDSIDSVVKSWLVDPQWQKVFKHTFDVFQDYISYVLVSVGLVSLSVRLLNTLGSGEIMCIIIGVEYNKTVKHGTLGPYPPGGGSFMVNFAQHNEGCIQTVLSPFVIYLPFIMLLQVFLLIVTEKITFRIPRLAQNIERFYLNVVEDSLFGKDLDGTEDMRDPRLSTAGIAVRRHRNEICVSLKRSSIIFNVYLVKKCVHLFLGYVFILLDIGFYLTMHISEKIPCRIRIPPFPGLLDFSGRIYYECQAKKMSFFLMAMRVHIALLILYVFCSLGSILWCLFFRSVTGLIRSIQSKNVPGKHSTKLKKKLMSTMKGGKDFLFLFDLLAHTCGLESTLRVLTHSDETFYQICKPKLDHKTMLVLEEDKLKVVWSAADVEVWLKTGQKSSRQKHIVVDSYEVTIFPAESVNNTHTIQAIESSGITTAGRPSIFFFNALNMPRSPSSPDVEDKIEEDMPERQGRLGSKDYSTWFFDLNGGRTEYVITIACMIGKSRMKGEKIVANLVPYGPEKPRSGMVRSATTKQVEIFWDPPKGEFTKYNLLIDHLDGSSFGRPSGGDRRPSSPFGCASAARLDSNLFLRRAINPGQRKVENLSYKLTTYTILGLEPGESYKITLGTKTGTVSTRYPITDIALTLPNEVRGIRATNITSSSCLLTWIDPETAHTCLKAFSIKVETYDGKIFKEMAVPRTTHSFALQGLMFCQDYDITMSALCVYGSLRTESEKVRLGLTTLPERTRNLHLDQSTPSSLTVKWDAPLITQGVRYQLNISAATNDSVKDNPALCDFEFSVELAGSEKSSYTFSKLPEIIGSGYPYTVQVRVVATSPREVEVTSEATVETFYTRPLPATGFHLVSVGEGWKIGWMPSLTPYVKHYKIRWKPLTNYDPTVGLSSQPQCKEEIITMDSEDSEESSSKDPIEYTFSPTCLQIGTPYRVNIHALVFTQSNQMIESKELHQKIEAKTDKELSVFAHTDTISLVSGKSS